MHVLVNIVRAGIDCSAYDYNSWEIFRHDSKCCKHDQYILTYFDDTWGNIDQILSGDYYYEPWDWYIHYFFLISVTADCECDNRCFRSSELLIQCCNAQCSAGCTGGNNFQCLVRNLNHNYNILA